MYIECIKNTNPTLILYNSDKTNFHFIHNDVVKRKGRLASGFNSVNLDRTYFCSFEFIFEPKIAGFFIHPVYCNISLRSLI